MSTALARISDEIYALRGDFESVMVDRSANFEREAGFAIQMVTANDYIQKVAIANPQSVRNAVTNIAAIGISLNPASKQAYLVPRKGAICLDISYMGLMHLAIDTGSIKWGQAKLVRESDVFALRGLDALPLHEYAPFSKNRGELVGVYVVVKTADGEYLTEPMDISEVYDIRDRSEGWKAYVKDSTKTCPWVTDPGEMIKKTVVKRAYKYWPKTERLEQAIHHLNTEGGEGIQFGQQGNKCDPALLSALIEKAKQAPTADALTGVWQSGLASIKATKDKGAYEMFKAAVALRGDQLKAASTVIEGEVERTDENH
jgi:recombination protein RecT